MKNEEIITIGCSEYPETILKINKNIKLEEVWVTVFYHGVKKYFDNKITERQLRGMLLETIKKFNLNYDPINECNFYVNFANKFNKSTWLYDLVSKATELDFNIGRTFH